MFVYSVFFSRYEGKLITLTVSKVLSELKKDQWIESENLSEIDVPSLSSVYEYDVFLSFMESDTRSEFTNHLYYGLVDAGVCTYLDSKELSIGEEIGVSIARAISKSKIFIPIISKNYASSKWCLEELTLMLQRMKEEKNHMIFPVFYGVSPTDVRHQNGNYARDLKEHEKKYDIRIVQQWREALTFVGNLKGIPLELTNR